MKIGIDRFTWNRFLSIQILTDFEPSNLTNTDTNFGNEITYQYRYRFLIPKNNISIPMLIKKILPIIINTDSNRYQQRLVNTWLHLPIRITTDFQIFNRIQTDIDFWIWITYQYWFRQKYRLTDADTNFTDYWSFPTWKEDRVQLRIPIQNKSCSSMLVQLYKSFWAKNSQLGINI